MAFEDIGPVEALLGGGARAWTEAADHGALVMGQSMSVFVVFSCETLLIVFACQDGAFFWSFRLVGKHVCLQIFENLATVRVRASTLFSALLIELGDGT